MIAWVHRIDRQVAADYGTYRATLRRWLAAWRDRRPGGRGVYLTDLDDALLADIGLYRPIRLVEARRFRCCADQRRRT